MRRWIVATLLASLAPLALAVSAEPTVAATRCVTLGQFNAVKADHYPHKGWSKARVHRAFGLHGKRVSRKVYRHTLIIEHRDYKRCGFPASDPASIWYKQVIGEDKRPRVSSKFW